MLYRFRTLPFAEEKREPYFLLLFGTECKNPSLPGRLFRSTSYLWKTIGSLVDVSTAVFMTRGLMRGASRASFLSAGLLRPASNRVPRPAACNASKDAIRASRGLASVRDLDGRTLSAITWFSGSPACSTPMPSLGDGGDGQPPDERTLKLGKSTFC
jgi:hypothetical protein